MRVSKPYVVKEPNTGWCLIESDCHPIDKLTVAARDYKKRRKLSEKKESNSSSSMGIVCQREADEKKKRREWRIRNIERKPG